MTYSSSPTREVLRPFAVVLGGDLRTGMEIVRDAGRIVEIRRHRGLPDPYVLSPAFVNAHSHLEYRSLQGKIVGLPYWDWLRELTQAKQTQTSDEVLNSCRIAAEENRRTGVAFIGEHSDRFGAAEAMVGSGLEGRIYQEVITIADDADAKWEAVSDKARRNQQHLANVVLSPHALFTVDERTLRRFDSSLPLSIHVAETALERSFFEARSGPIQELVDRLGAHLTDFRGRPFEYARQVGHVRAGAQFVHGCDLEVEEFRIMAEAGVSLAHCPRSNIALGCPAAKIREALDQGVQVGLGLDSAASSGPIDMFAEMRAAMTVAERRGYHLTPAEVWAMATDMGAASLGRTGWRIEEGSDVPLIKLHMPDVISLDDLIERGSPDIVEWV